MSIKQSWNDTKLLPGEIENTNRLALHIFLIGVNPQISLMLRSRGPNNFNEAFNIALEEEKFHLLQNSKNKICMKCHKPGHIATHCRSYNPNKNNYIETTIIEIILIEIIITILTENRVINPYFI